jgi:L-seryl-tRNA(Ser) seleniumtransferase
LVLKVHPSNYRIEGFTDSAGLADLAGLTRARGIPLIFDAGSGLLDERTPWLPGPPPAWLSGEPGIRQSLEAGADLVMFSGDKLLGGPQAGILVGRVDLIERLRRHPVARAVRMDGPTLAGLTVTMEAYASGRAAALPFWRMATLGLDSLEQRARRVLEASGADGSIVPGASLVGAGSVPGAEVPSPQIVLPDGDDRYATLLAHRPPVLARRREGSLVVDLRAVDPEDDDHVAAALRWR